MTKVREYMTIDEMLVEVMKGQLFTYNELRDTFLAGSRMASEHHISWREAFDKWILTLAKPRSDVLDLS